MVLLFRLHLKKEIPHVMVTLMMVHPLPLLDYWILPLEKMTFFTPLLLRGLVMTKKLLQMTWGVKVHHIRSKNDKMA